MVAEAAVVAALVICLTTYCKILDLILSAAMDLAYLLKK